MALLGDFIRDFLRYLARDFLRDFLKELLRDFLRVLLDKLPDIETPIVWGQFSFGCIINSTYSGGLPKLKSLDLGACTVPWDANQVLELKQAFFGQFT